MNTSQRQPSTSPLHLPRVRGRIPRLIDAAFAFVAVVTLVCMAGGAICIIIGVAILRWFA